MTIFRRKRPATSICTNFTGKLSSCPSTQSASTIVRLPMSGLGRTRNLLCSFQRIHNLRESSQHSEIEMTNLYQYSFLKPYCLERAQSLHPNPTVSGWILFGEQSEGLPSVLSSLSTITHHLSIMNHALPSLLPPSIQASFLARGFALCCLLSLLLIHCSLVTFLGHTSPVE